MGTDEETSRSTFPAGTVPRPSVVCCARGVGAPAADAGLGEKPVPFSARPRDRCGGGEGQLQATLTQSFQRPVQPRKAFLLTWTIRVNGAVFLVHHCAINHFLFARLQTAALAFADQSEPD